MTKLKREEMLLVRGGTALTSAMLNALMRTLSTMFTLGQAVGSAIRRTISGGYC